MLENTNFEWKEKNWGKTARLQASSGQEVWYGEFEKDGFSSIHCHEHKSNRIFVVSGSIVISLYEEQTLEEFEKISEIIVNSGQFSEIPPKVFHKFKALEKGSFIETYIPSDDFDITRATY